MKCLLALKVLEIKNVNLAKILHLLSTKQFKLNVTLFTLSWNISSKDSSILKNQSNKLKNIYSVKYIFENKSTQMNALNYKYLICN